MTSSPPAPSALRARALSLAAQAGLAGSFACASAPATRTAEPCGPAAPTGVRVGDCAPAFALPDRDGVDFSLRAQRGKVALVDISAIW